MDLRKATRQHLHAIGEVVSQIHGVTYKKDRPRRHKPHKKSTITRHSVEAAQ
ncbi:hypothetical protein M2322_002655 [Rhodoblastus acidophilus]|uniref:hypothetical protein n=1 Tax=Rhodoblastus acidophilus TaxID=1074 RepID=UPI002224B75C|nr:hypothetical protein [Rhodoblastus acidophilus]MCW2317101.1 hypothetical protein [Rhodoblastus acidophilus]